MSSTATSRDSLSRHSSSTSSTDVTVEVFDLFSGAGGFSTGAVMAGAKVVCAYDSDEATLQVHKNNHPYTRHVCRKLPCTELPFPTDGRQWHLHASPPCQKFSTACTAQRETGDKEESLALVEWSLHMALTSGCQTWSLEQVRSKQIIQLLNYYRTKYPTRVAYCVFDFSHLGVPQTRCRIIASTPYVVAALMRMQKAQSVVISDAILEPRGTHIQNASYSVNSRNRRVFSAGTSKIVKQRAVWGEHCRPLHKPCYTILANRGYAWVTVSDDGKSLDHSRLLTKEYAALQTFPDDYQWPANKALALKMIGNSVPPHVAKLIMQIVMHKQ